MKLSPKLFSRPSRLLRWLSTCAILALMLGCTTAARAQAPSGAPRYPAGSMVDRHGALQVIDRRLCDQQGAPVLLRGISTHDLKAFGRFANREGIRFLAREWKVTVVRPALYVESFLADRTIEQRLDEIVAACEENGIYCLVDWHVLHERNPQRTQEEAVAFFQRKATQYRDRPHVIFEICNEPNGPEVTWREHVKPFAEAVIPVIRALAPRSVVIVGTPTWSQDVDLAAQDPLPYENLLYAMHFYAGSHGEALREKVREASRRVAIFCSEWGTTLASGDGGPFPAESKEWLDFIEANGISWCNWSLSDAAEASALLRPGARSDGGWADDELTESGRWVKARLLQPPHTPSPSR